MKVSVRTDSSGNLVLVELKFVGALARVHRQRLLSYLRVTNLRSRFRSEDFQLFFKTSTPI